MTNNPKTILYILMVSTMAINTPLSIVGMISEISKHFHTSIAISGLFVSSFTFTIAICGLFMPVVFSKHERKKTFASILAIFSVCSLILMFAEDIYIASFARILSAVFYPAFISIALTIIEDIAPENQRQDYITRILLGISIGSIVGLPITTGIGTILGYQSAMAWIFSFSLVSLISIVAFFPEMPGHSKHYKCPRPEYFQKKSSCRQ